MRCPDSLGPSKGAWAAFFMKRRILFVHENPSELQGFHQAVVAMEPVWDMEFASSGEQALQVLAGSKFDAVVVDVPPQQATGLSFLNEARNQHAGMTRFAIANQDDKETVMACAREMHQCLPRPCQPRTLIAGIRRSLSLDGWLQDEKIKSLVERMPPLPSLPAVYNEVIRELNDASGSAEKVAEILSKDLSLTARLLQTVNSAFYGQSRRITHVGEAVVVLGTEAVRGMVLGLQTYQHFEKMKPFPFAIDRLWAHSMAVAERARRIALLQTRQPELADEAFTAGLMHDIGVLVLAASLPKEYRELWQKLEARKQPLWQVEKEILGASHADVGAYLLARWGLPITLVEAVAYHHEPSRGWQEGFGVLTAVHAADGVLGAENPGCETVVPPDLDSEYLVTLGLQDRVDTWRKCGTLQPARSQTARSTAHPVPVASPKVLPVDTARLRAEESKRYWLVASAAAAVLALTGAIIWWGTH